MPEPVLIDQVHVSLFLLDGATRTVADAAAAALDRQEFLDGVHGAIRSVLDAEPALAMLSLTVEW